MVTKRNENFFMIPVGEINADLERCEHLIQDLAVPAGMGQFDTAEFTNVFADQKAQIRLRMKALETVKQQIKTRCLNYAIRIERQLQAQSKSQHFLNETHKEVNNYFKAHSGDVYTKLQKAAQLIGHNDPEDLSLLLTEVRRAIKSAADYFYPPVTGPVKCADGEERELGDEQYLNRLHEYLTTVFEKSSSRDLLNAEFEHLAVFARRLNDLASKGVHAEVSANEGKQALLGLYMFLYNVVLRLQERLRNT